MHASSELTSEKGAAVARRLFNTKHRHDLRIISGSTKGMVGTYDFTIIAYGVIKTTANSLHE